jgi:hypothetical protein
MMMHAIVDFDNPDLAWFYVFQTVRITVGRVDCTLLAPMWVKTREKNNTGAILEYTLPEGIYMN